MARPKGALSYNVDTVRDKVLRYLVERGPADAKTIARDLNVSPMSVYSALNRNTTECFVFYRRVPSERGGYLKLWSCWEE